MSAVIESTAHRVAAPLIAAGDRVARDRVRCTCGDVAARHASGAGARRGRDAAGGRACDQPVRGPLPLPGRVLRGRAARADHLLPPSRAPARGRRGAGAASRQLLPRRRRYSQPAPPRYVRLPDVLPQRDGEAPTLDDDALVAIGFTSGSTGRPQANPKTWGSFRASTAQNLAALADLLAARRRSRTSSPPCRRSTCTAWRCRCCCRCSGRCAVHAARPFFPDDIARALRDARAPRAAGHHAGAPARAGRIRRRVAAAGAASSRRPRRCRRSSRSRPRRASAAKCAKCSVRPKPA